MSSMKVFSRTVILFCTLLLFFALTGRTYAANPDQRTTTSGQILTIQISNDVTGSMTPGGLITMTGHTALYPSQWQTAPIDFQSTSIDHVEVRIDQGAPITVTLDGLGNWSTVFMSCISGSIKVEATVVAKDGTQVTADMVIPCQCDPDTLEPKQPTRLFIFLPVISTQ